MQDIFENLGIYLHVPFCAQNCDYCHFYKRTPTKEILDSYIETLSEEIQYYKNHFCDSFKRPQTMFLGGGTPSTLTENNIENLAKALDGYLPTLEWTVEVAPTNATKTKLQLLKDIGVTRISMGVQSFNQTTLNTLGRKHSLSATLSAIERVNDVNFKHFSIDLIFGAKNQSKDDWIADINQAVTMPVDHISAYCLEFESATSCCAGRLTDENYSEFEREGEFLEIAMQMLPSFGFNQYEISNYSKPNAECIHNLATWNMAQWIGLGPSAASQFDKKRYRNHADLDIWTKSVKSKSPKYCDIVNLDDNEMFSSALIFGLRINNGINLATLSKRFPNANILRYIETINYLTEQNLIIKDGDIIKLSNLGRTLADSIAVELL